MKDKQKLELEQILVMSVVNSAGLAGKYQWREFPLVITGKYRPGKYSKFELKWEILGNMIFRCD